MQDDSSDSESANVKTAIFGEMGPANCPAQEITSEDVNDAFCLGTEISASRNPPTTLWGQYAWENNSPSPFPLPTGPDTERFPEGGRGGVPP